MRFPDSKAAKIIILFSETPFCHFSVEQCGTGLIHDSYPVASRSYVNITIEARSRGAAPLRSRFPLSVLRVQSK